MRLESADNKPTLLMLSTCFPDPDGSARAARAWRLLERASETHRVHLSAIADRPVNLNLWRQVAKRIERVHLIGKRRVRTTPVPYSGEALTWTQQIGFDALLTIGPEAWPRVFPSGIGTAICDMGNGELLDHPQPAQPQSLLTRFRLGRSHTTTMDVISACDHVTLAGWNQAWRVPGHRWKVRLLPDDGMTEAWARLFPDKASSQDIPPAVTVLPAQASPLRQAA